MSETEIGGLKYRIGTLSARKQFNVLKRLAKPLAAMGKLEALIPKDSPEQLNFGQVLGPLADAIANISDEDSDYVIDQCLAVCDRQQGTGSGPFVWAPLVRGGNLMFQDLQMATMLVLTFNVLKESLGDFFSSDQPSSPQAGAATAQT